MTFAMIHDGLVKEIAYLYNYERKKYKNAVPVGHYAVRPGDIWDGEHFYHNGERALTLEQNFVKETKDIVKALRIMGVPISDDGIIDVGTPAPKE